MERVFRGSVDLLLELGCQPSGGSDVDRCGSRNCPAGPVLKGALASASHSQLHQLVMPEDVRADLVAKFLEPNPHHLACVGKEITAFSLEGLSGRDSSDAHLGHPTEAR